MSNMTLGLNFIVTGMVVVFITLAVMSGAMWVTGKLFGGGKKRLSGGESGKHSDNLSKAEIAAVSVAVHQYRTASESDTGGRETVPDFKPLERWKMRARIESVERN